MTTPLLETLASYVPRALVSRLRINPTPIGTPIAEKFAAATLFADISGFTALTERLAAQGPAGTELLTQELNTYFGLMIDIIYNHGGDVVKFAGDALTAMWPTSGNNDSALSDATIQAAACALSIQTALLDYRTANGDILALSIGVGAGKATMSHIGGVYGRWEHLLTGDSLIQSAQSEILAHSGEVVVSYEAWQLLNGRGTGHPVSDNAVRLNAINSNHTPTIPTPPILPTEAENALRAYIPGAILARLAAGQGSWLAELRRITVLFINLPDLTYATPLRDGQASMRALQEALYRYEGSVNKISVDDKGVTLIAALGLPPLSHENDALRGIRAALDIVASLEELNWHCAIGVTTGRAFCGTVGSKTRREYTMIGDVVNLSARLMQAAASLPSEDSTDESPILCDKATYQAAQEHITFSVLSPIKVKGKTDPILIFRPSTEKTSPHFKDVNPKFKAKMVGRSAERAALIDSLQTLQSGHSRTFIIEGEAGIGKSRLAAELLHQARIMNVTAFLGTGDAIEKNASYHAWRSIFWTFFGLDVLNEIELTLTERLREVQRDHVMFQLLETAPEFERLAPLLNAVLSLDLPDNDLTAQMSGQVRADNTHDLLLGLLQKKAKNAPLLLILEDAHWLDSASWAFARRVSRDVSPLLLVIVTRPIHGQIPVEYTYLRGLPNGRYLSLTTLPPTETLQLVCQSLGIEMLPEAVSTLLLKKAEGHPFFSEELAYALRDTGILEIKDGIGRINPTAGDLRNLDFPDTIESIIISRIDLLSPQQQLTLKVASVIGRVFTFRTLDAIHPIENDRVHLSDYLNALEDLDLTPVEAPEPDLKYIFKHIITQEAAYNLMLFAQRRQLHRAIAQWLERTYADNLSPFYPLLAYHWRRALDKQNYDPDTAAKAIHYLSKAGKQALNNYANQEAVDFFNQALSLDARFGNSRNKDQQGCWERELGEAYYKLGKIANGREHLERAASLVGHPIPITAFGLGYNLTVQILRQLLHRILPAKHTVHSQNPNDILEIPRIYEQLGLVYLFDNETILLLYVWLFELNQMEKKGESSQLARSYGRMGILTGVSSLHWLAKFYNARALKMAKSTNQLATLRWVWTGIGLYNTSIGQWSKARDAWHQSAQIATRLGDQRRQDESASVLGWIHYFLGEFLSGTNIFLDLTQSANRRGDPQTHNWGLCGQVENALPVGNIPIAQSLLLMEKAESLLAKNLAQVDKIRVYGLLAKIYWRLGKSEEAQQTAAKALQLVEGVRPSIFYGCEGYSSIAEVYLGLWEAAYVKNSVQHKDLKLASQRACKALRNLARVFPIIAPRAWLWQGTYHWLNGKHRRAYKAWQKSLDHAKELEMPYEQGLAHYEIGRHLPASNSNRGKYLKRAKGMFAKLGANYDLARIQKETISPSSPL